MADFVSQLFVYVSLIVVLVSRKSISADGVSHQTSPSYCPQLGCDQAGTFTQDKYKLPMTLNGSVVWKSLHPQILKMNPENENYGCVGSSKLVVCPFHPNMLKDTQHVMINPDTGEVYNTSGYETLYSTNMPILTEDNLVFALNNESISLVDPLNSKSFVSKLPNAYPQGVNSPIYLPQLGFYVILGNFSESHAIYKINKNALTETSELTLVTTFTVAKKGKSCLWLPVTQPVTNGNRVFFYAVQRDGNSGIVAVDFMAEAPYFTKAWELPDEPGVSNLKSQKIQTENCTYVPAVDPDYSNFPPVDVNIQMLATPDNYIIITSPTGLITIKDHGDSVEQAAISLVGAHFVTLDTTPTKKGKAPIVWMTGWSPYPEFANFLIAYNYTDVTSLESSIWAIGFQKLGIQSINVTSRISTFVDQASEDKKILVFGASVNSTSTDTPFYKKYCMKCKLGIVNMLVAVRTSYENTDPADIVWMMPVPISPSSLEIRGQIIGVADKLILYITNGNTGYIVAVK